MVKLFQDPKNIQEWLVWDYGTGSYWTWAVSSWLQRRLWRFPNPTHTPCSGDALSQLQGTTQKLIYLIIYIYIHTQSAPVDHAKRCWKPRSTPSDSLSLRHLLQELKLVDETCPHMQRPGVSRDVSNVWRREYMRIYLWDRGWWLDVL